MSTAYSYVRFSTPEQLSGDSLRRQTEAAARYAREKDLKLDTTLNLRDLGVSAWKGKNFATGALGTFLSAVKDGIVTEGSYLLVERLDRLTRQDMDEAIDLIRGIVRSGVVVVTLHNGRIYDRAALNDMIAWLIMVTELYLAAEQSREKSARGGAAWSQKRAQASEKPLTARGPAWLRLVNGNWEVIPERADVIRRIFREYLDGAGPDTIARRLNRDGVPTFGKADRWHRSYVFKILRNSAVTGVYVPHRRTEKGRQRVGEPIPGYYPSVITEDEWSATECALHERTAEASEARGMKNWLGGGLLRCGQCGDAVIRVDKGRKDMPRLVCHGAKMGAGCTYRSIPTYIIETSVLNAMPDLIEGAPAGLPDEFSGVAEDILGRLRSEVRGLDDAEVMKKWFDLMERTGRDLERRVRESEAMAERASERLVRQRMLRLAAAIQKPWDRGELNGALRAAVETMTLDFEERTVTVVWKHAGVGSTAIHSE